eukprot:3204429-Rhodomonas_salina.1
MERNNRGETAFEDDSERMCVAGSDAHSRRDKRVVRDRRDQCRHHEAGWRGQVSQLCAQARLDRDAGVTA